MQSQIPIGGLRDTTMEDQNTSIEVGELIYNTIDPLDPRKVSFDIFEAYCHEMLTTNYVGRRANLISQMRVSTKFFIICDGACVLCFIVCHWISISVAGNKFCLRCNYY